MSKWTDNLKKGDWLSRISYIRILEQTSKGYRVENASGFSWTIGEDIIENECEPAFECEGTENMTQTQLVDLLLTEARGCVVEVRFTKKQTPERILQQLSGTDVSSMSKAAAKKFASQLLIGEERVLVGYVIGTDMSGRIKMVDLNISDKNNVRLVDPRTLSEVTLRKKKYVKR